MKTKRKLTKVINTLETLVDIPKRATKDIANTFNPLKALEGSDTKPAQEMTEKPGYGQNHTPLNVDKIKSQHELDNAKQKKKTDDEAKLATLRQQLFRKVQEDEAGAIRSRREEATKKKEEEMTEEQRKQKEIQERLAQQSRTDIPQGKEQRGGFFAIGKKRRKKAVQENYPEMRGSGKH